jgi:RHS repeat-associated protein
VRTETAGAKTGLILYDEAGRWLADYDSAGKVTRQAVWMDDYLVGLVDNGKVLYVEPDHLGSPRAVIDPVSKVTLWRWRPSDDPFGTAPPEEDADADGSRFVFDLRLPGQRYDAVTGLYYNYFRDYDAATGRYIQVDPIGLAGGINPYLYANGSPLKYTDPTGEFGVVGAVLGAVFEVGGQAFTNYRRGCDVLNARNYNWAQVGFSAFVGAVAPGWLATIKKVLPSTKAISTLTGQLGRARTASRIAKVEARVSNHKRKIQDLLVPQVGLTGTKTLGQLVLDTSTGSKCGCGL